MSFSTDGSCFRDFTKNYQEKNSSRNLTQSESNTSTIYKIGSTCLFFGFQAYIAHKVGYLSFKESNATTSEDFFKSSLIICGTLALVCVVVKTCWNRFIDSRAKDPFIVIPSEVIVNNIFCYLNLHELGSSKKVSKTWNQSVIPSSLWQSAIYHELAFSNKSWSERIADIVADIGLKRERFAYVVGDIDLKEEILSLPPNIAEELKRSAFPGSSIRETHVLVRMPRGLSLRRLEVIARKYFPNHPIIHYNDDLEDKSVDQSVWLLMTKDVLQGSRKKTYIQQKNIIAQLNEKTEVLHQIPTTLEAATCILAEYFRSKNRLFSDTPLTYTRCEIDAGGEINTIVGNFTSAGFCVKQSYYDSDCIGVAALRKF